MQNKYTADIGDYSKYGLLRALLPKDYKLGLVWYLVPDEQHLKDGRHINYLSENKFRYCDPKLFEILQKIISSDKRNISVIEQSKILPENTVFFSEYLSYDNIKANTLSGRQERILLRDKWLVRALETVKDCDVVFLDPDNGLETPSVKKHLKKAGKYVFYDEVKKFLSITDTLIIYQHFSRHGDHISQIREKEKILQELAGNSYKFLSLRFRPYSQRVYFILTRSKDIIDKIEKFINSEWKQCFELMK